jgi:signal transduction histidine kinase
LKTAVAVVKSSLQLLELKERTPAEYQAGLERCLADSARLEALVAKMLTLARVESGANGSAGAHARCDMVACVRETRTRLDTVAALRGVTVCIRADGSYMVPIAGEDCVLLVENLLMNAIEHSPGGSKVELHLRGDDGSVVMDVEDHGEGIRPEALPHVFERFSRGDPSRARSTGGSGLGLAICKAVVEKAGGTIELASELGAGTRVNVRLPAA